MKKILSICLTFLLLFTSMVPVFINPPVALGATAGQAGVVETVGDGLSYYVVFDYNGIQYRSDEMGPAFNSRMWEMLNETDKKKVAYNYAFAPSYRNDQFGTAGSAAIADWSNEVSGWKAAGEAWEKAIGEREYSDLAAFFGGNSNDLPIGEKTLFEVEQTLKALSAEIKTTEDYRTATQLAEEINNEYAAGQATYEKLAEIKAKQIGNAFKAGSELIIKDIIIDNVMIPSITRGASEISGVVADGLNFLKGEVVQLYDDLIEEPEVTEVLATMQEMLNILEQTANALESDISSKSGELASLLEQLQEENENKIKEQEDIVNQKKEAADDKVNTSIVWTEDVQSYGIQHVAETNDEYAAIKQQVLDEADSIKGDYESILNNITGTKHDIYDKLLDFDDGGILGAHPDFTQKAMNNNIFVSPYIGNFNLQYPIEPWKYFYSDTSYSGIKALIATDGEAAVSKQDQGITLLEQYLGEVEAFLADETIKTGLESVAERINGLEFTYQHYFNSSLDYYVLNGYRDTVFRGIKENMLQMLKTADINDYDELEDAKARKNLYDVNIKKAQEEMSALDSGLIALAAGGGGVAGYDSLYTNLQNSATFMLGAYNSLKQLHEDSPYITFIDSYGQALPAVNEDYVNSSIEAASPAEKEAVRQTVLADLREIHKEELDYMHKFDVGHLNCQYDAGQLDRLLTELGLISNASSANLEELLGKSIIKPAEYLQEDVLVKELYAGRFTPKMAGISRFIERFEGTSDAYYNAMLTSDEIEANTDYLLSLSDDDFETEFANYKNLLDDCMASSYCLNTQQVDNARAEYNRGYRTLQALQIERLSGSSEIVVESIEPVFYGTLTAATGIELGVGDTCRLNVIITPSNATNQQVFWHSDNTNVVTVTNEGLVTGVADGTAYINIAAADGNATAACYVVVGTDESGGGGGAGALAVAKELAAEKVQADYTSGSWGILMAALELPETTADEINIKTTAINDAIAGLVLVSEGDSDGDSGGSGDSGDSDDSLSSTTAPSTTTTPDGTTTTSIDMTANLNNATGSAVAPVSAKAMSTLINQAKTVEVAGRKAVIEIKIDAAPEAKAVELEISEVSFASVANETQANVTINTPVAIITFDNQAVQTIDNAASTGDVSINIANLDKASLSQEARAIVGDRPVYEFSVKTGNSEVSDFKDGRAYVSIPYAPKPGEKENAIVVYYLDQNQNLIAVRGAFNSATDTVDFAVNHFSGYVIGYNEVSFEDVQAGQWYSNAVDYLAARDIVKGIGAGKFGPTQKTTRGQFIVMMMRTYEIDPEENSTDNFADAGNTYYTDYLAAAKKLNIVKGIGNNMYAPERYITRQEMFTMLYNALKSIDELPEGNSGKSLESFRDAGVIASWAQPAMQLFAETGTVRGSDEQFMPLAESSRAEMAQVLYNLLNR